MLLQLQGRMQELHTVQVQKKGEMGEGEIKRRGRGDATSKFTQQAGSEREEGSTWG